MGRGSKTNWLWTQSNIDAIKPSLIFVLMGGFNWNRSLQGSIFLDLFHKKSIGLNSALEVTQLKLLFGWSQNKAPGMTQGKEWSQRYPIDKKSYAFLRLFLELLTVLGIPILLWLGPLIFVWFRLVKQIIKYKKNIFY